MTTTLFKMIKTKHKKKENTSCKGKLELESMAFPQINRDKLRNGERAAGIYRVTYARGRLLSTKET